jgi:hypothetical protein
MGNIKLVHRDGLVCWIGDRCRRRYDHDHGDLGISECNSDDYSESDRCIGHAVPDESELHLGR